MKKKWITLSLAVMTSISMTACGVMGGSYETVDGTKVVVVNAGKNKTQEETTAAGDFWETDTAGEDTLPKIVIAAEVAQVDDEEDPEVSAGQEANGETGAAVDLGQLIAQEKAKQETQTGQEGSESESTQASQEESQSESTQAGQEGSQSESTQADQEGSQSESTQSGQEGSQSGQVQPTQGSGSPQSSQQQNPHQVESKPQETETTTPETTETETAQTQESAQGTRGSSGLSYGIDVSKWQDKIDWQAVKNTGIDFAIIRVGYRTQKTGVIMEDPYARYNLQEASKAGIKMGAYFFSTAVTQEEAVEEAAWLCSVIDQYPITYPVVYNCEGFRNEGNRQYGMSKEARTDMAVAFLDYVKAKGYSPMFYAARNELTDSSDWDTDRLASKYPIWVSQYPTIPYPETPRSTYDGEHAMWQYTSQGTVDGISKPVDVNVAYFTIDQTASAKGSAAPEVVKDSPELGITFTETSELVTAKIATNLRTVPSTDSQDTVVYKLPNGETVIRTGVGDNGWSRVEYQGQVLYAVSSYLTTDGVSQSGTAQTVAPQSQGTGENGVQAGPGAEPGTSQEQGPGIVSDQVSPATPSQEASVAGDSAVYQEVNEQVTAKNRTNLRSKPGSDYADTIVTTLNYGDVAVRTGIGNNGWSRVEYNGQTLYAVTSYLTTDLESGPQADAAMVTEPGLADFPGLAFTAVRENVTAKIETNLRTEPSTRSDDTIVVKLMNGDVAVRTGLGSNGWSRVEYDGQVLYAVTSYLVTVP